MDPKHPPKGIFLLPNLLTTAGLFTGFFAIVQASAGQYTVAAIAIFVALVLDGLDGRVARLTNTSSDFGTHYDSLVDMVSFGLTPALVLYDWSLSGRGKLGWLVAFVYVAAAGLRLARFNAQHGVDRRYFRGLPCPSAAALAAGLVWVLEGYGYSGKDVSWPVAIFTAALALAMVSPIPYRSFKDFDLKGRVPFVFTLAVVLVIVLISFDPSRALFLLFALYVLSGPVLWITGVSRRDREKHAAAKKSTDPPLTQVGAGGKSRR